MLPWLDELGIRSAVTCNPGLAGPRSRLLLLPRVIDTSAIPSLEFDAWLTGVRECLPVRPVRWDRDS
jgi:hypothetical protein